jgi:hypothetical protein
MFESFVDRNPGRELAAELVMMRAYDARTFLIVEGSTDKRVFSAFVDIKQCEIFIAGCRNAAVSGLMLSKELHLAGIICVVDKDYDAFLPELPSHPDLIVNDDHDLEITMIRSAAFEKVFSELGSATKIVTSTQEGKDPRSRILRAAHSYGLVRLYSLDHNLGFRFEGLRFRSVQRDLSVSHEDIVSELINHSNMHGYDRQPILEHIQRWSDTKHNEWLMCCGHDFAALIGLSLKSLFGSQTSIATQHDNIERLLRLAFGAEEFVSCNLYAKIKLWESQNIPYKVLRI